MMLSWRCFTSLVMPLARGLGHRVWKEVTLVFVLGCGIRKEMEQALITESFGI